MGKYPRRIFEDSAIFQDMIAMPQAGDQNEEGSSEGRPLVFESVKLHAFVLFARVVQAQHVSKIFILRKVSSYVIQTCCSASFLRGLARRPAPIRPMEDEIMRATAIE